MTMPPKVLLVPLVLQTKQQPLRGSSFLKLQLNIIYIQTSLRITHKAGVCFFIYLSTPSNHQGLPKLNIVHGCNIYMACLFASVSERTERTFCSLHFLLLMFLIISILLLDLSRLNLQRSDFHLLKSQTQKSQMELLFCSQLKVNRYQQSQRTLTDSLSPRQQFFCELSRSKLSSKVFKMDKNH